MQKKKQKMLVFIGLRLTPAELKKCHKASGCERSATAVSWIVRRYLESLKN